MAGTIKSMLQETARPLPVRAGRRHRPPLEARTNWDPWLPPQEAYPEISRPLRVSAIALLAVVAFAVLVALFLLL